MDVSSAARLPSMLGGILERLTSGNNARASGMARSKMDALVITTWGVALTGLQT
jgi:hypothetical protein